MPHFSNWSRSDRMRAMKACCSGATAIIFGAGAPGAAAGAAFATVAL
jgi:hypothetical protein